MPAVQPHATKAPEKPLVVAPLPMRVPEQLPHTFEPTSYAARLRVDPAQPTFAGTIEITGELTKPSTLIWVNAEKLAIEGVTASRAGTRVRLAAKYHARDGWLALQSEQPIAAGTWTLSISYSGTWNEADAWGGFRQTRSGNARDNDPERYVFTQFEPDYARKVFPCFDAPDRKVPWQLTLEVPDGVVAASNTPIEHEQRERSTRIVRFAKTPPLPSYLIAFAVGPFDVVEAARSQSGIPIRILTQRGDAARATHAKHVAPRLLDELEGWLGVPFPYPKVDFVAVPRTANWWGAMENAGLVTFDVRGLGDPRIFDSNCIHELAHHWFGDLVTPVTWRDIWLNESFAYWVAERFGYDRRFEGTMYEPPIVAGTDAADARHQLGSSTAQGGSAFTGIHKGKRLLALLEGLLGEQQLVRVLQRYLTSHAHGNARTADLRAAFAAVAGEDVAALIDRYAHTPTEPLALELRCDAKRSRVEVKGFTTTGLVCIAYDRDGKRADRCSTLAWGASAIELDAKRCPRWILPTAAHELDWTVAQLEAIRDHGWAALHEHERIAMTGQVLAHQPMNLRLRLSYIEKAASALDPMLTGWVATYVLALDPHVPPSLRAQFEAWVIKVFGSRAAPLASLEELDEQDRAQQMTVQFLLLRARAAAVVHDAVAQLPKLDKLPGPARVAVLLAAIVDKPSLAADLIRELPTAKPDRRADIAFALETAPNLLDLMQQHVAEIKQLHDHQKQRLLGRVCDESRRAEVEQLGRDIFAKWDAFVLRDFDWCISERNFLEPELKAFFAAEGSQLRR